MILDLAMISWIRHQKQRKQKQKQANGSTSNLKTSVHERIQSIEKKGQSPERKKILASYISDKELISRIYKELI